MKTFRSLACLLLAVGSAQSLSGQTLHPLYKDKTEEVVEPALLGTWASCGGSAFVICVGLQFEKSPNGGYRVSLPLEETPKMDAVYALHLVRFGDALLADLKLTDILVAGKSLGLDFQTGLIQAHGIFRVSLKAEKLVTSGVDFKLVETQKALAENGVHLRLETLDDGSVLALDPTAGLQQFARKMANDRRVFSDDTEWERPPKDQQDGKEKQPPPR